MINTLLLTLCNIITGWFVIFIVFIFFDIIPILLNLDGVIKILKNKLNIPGIITFYVIYGMLSILVSIYIHHTIFYPLFIHK